jgi:hypothetical protein
MQEQKNGDNIYFQPAKQIINKPTRAVECTNRKGKLSAIPLSDILKAVELARDVPLEKKPLFPQNFGNSEVRRASPRFVVLRNDVGICRI